MGDDQDECMHCGHARGEHGVGFFSPCEVDECDCPDFELAHDEDD